MMWLILGAERCGGTGWIDMIVNVHVEVSRERGFGVTLFKITSNSLTRLKRVRFKNIFLSEFICVILLIKRIK
jgi:hypothetical protein